MDLQTKATAAALPPFAELDMKPPRVEVTRGDGGVIYLRSPYPIPEAPRSLSDMLTERAARHADRTFVAQRGPDGAWRHCSYKAAKETSDRIAAGLLAQGYGQDTPIMILSGNSIEHALLMLGALAARVPVAPVSVAYSLMSTDFAKLRHVFTTCKPRMIFADHGGMYGRALQALKAIDPSVDIVTLLPAEGIEQRAFATLAAADAGPAVQASIAATTPETIAKYLFTSGSTGLPKGVLQTQGMLCANIANQKALRIDDSEPEDPPAILDWMPWNHISAGNIAFNGMLANGGTIYLDAGRPIPGMFDATIANLKEVSPTTYGSAPIAFTMLADAMERDPALRDNFFRRLKVLGYGGATLSQDLYGRLQALAIQATGKRIAITTMYGSTEAQGVTTVFWATERVGLIGLPLPGMTLKLVPNGLKHEVRVKGPTVTPGYLNRPDLTEAAFDEEGFYKLGDAATFVDPHDPAQGLVFDGRVTEDFKLSSGTWVSVGTLRAELIAALTPLIQDAVIAGQDKDYAAVLAWPNMTAAREICTDANRVTPDELLASPDIQKFVKDRLTAFNKSAGGSSGKVMRMLLMTEPPSIDGHEITDKGYINQRATLDRRAKLVDELYADPPHQGVITL